MWRREGLARGWDSKMWTERSRAWAMARAAAEEEVAAVREEKEEATAAAAERRERAGGMGSLCDWGEGEAESSERM